MVDDFNANPDFNRDGEFNRNLSASHSSGGGGGDQPRAEDYKHWVSDEDLMAAMQMEQTVFGRDLSSGASKQLARQLFQENAAAAAQSIIKTAIHGSTEKVRFDAAKYVLERALGPVSNVGKDEGEGKLEPLEAAVAELQRNTGGRSPGHPG